MRPSAGLFSAELKIAHYEASGRSWPILLKNSKSANVEFSVKVALQMESRCDFG